LETSDLSEIVLGGAAVAKEAVTRTEIIVTIEAKDGIFRNLTSDPEKRDNVK
jgi:hypothetical protein